MTDVKRISLCLQRNSLLMMYECKISCLLLFASLMTTKIWKNTKLRFQVGLGPLISPVLQGPCAGLNPALSSAMASPSHSVLKLLYDISSIHCHTLGLSNDTCLTEKLLTRNHTILSQFCLSQHYNILQHF